MPDSRSFDLVVIGSGPGGYVAAIRAAQLGLDVAVVDERKRMGGTCLNIGCIPSKAMLESSHRFAQAREELAAHGVRTGPVELDLETLLQRKDEIVGRVTQGVGALFWKWKIVTYTGRASLLAPGRLAVAVPGGADPGIELVARHIIIATGSVPASLPGVEFDGERIGTSAEALGYRAVPEHLIVIGAGAIGLELGSVWRRLGARVTVLEYLDRILPGIDAEIAAGAQQALAQQGLAFHLGARVTGARVQGGGCVVDVEGHEPFASSHVLVAVGRRPNTDGLGCENVHIALDARGRIPVDERFATATPGIYAVGDVIRGPMLAHKASEEGIACVEGIVTGHGRVNYDAIPNIVYTWPEVASVGATEEELRERGIPFRTGTFPFLANGRAHALGEIGGRVKMLANASTDRVLGVHILGPHAGDLIAEATAAIEFGASSEDVARVCHAHPTLSEAVREAALAVDRRALHV